MTLPTPDRTLTVDFSVFPTFEKNLSAFEHTGVVPFTQHDGGRGDAGFASDQAGDCVARAWAIVLGLPYRRVYDELAERQQQFFARKAKRRSKYQEVYARKAATKSANRGVHRDVIHQFAADHGFTWVPTMWVGTGTTVHVRPDELPSGRLVLNLSKHVAAFVDGRLFDNHDSARGGTRAVYDENLL